MSRSTFLLLFGLAFLIDCTFFAVAFNLTDDKGDDKGKAAECHKCRCASSDPREPLGLKDPSD